MQKLGKILLLFFLTLSLTSIIHFLNQANDPRKYAAENISPKCRQLTFIKGEILNKGKTIYPHQKVDVTCDYGLVSSGISPKISTFDWLTCRFNKWQGTTAFFECIAPESPGLYVHSCLNYETSDNICPQENIGQSYTVTKKN